MPRVTDLRTNTELWCPVHSLWRSPMCSAVLSQAACRCGDAVSELIAPLKTYADQDFLRLGRVVASLW